MLMILEIEDASTTSSVLAALSTIATILHLKNHGLAVEPVQAVFPRRKEDGRSEEASNTSSLRALDVPTTTIRSLLGRVDHRPMTRGTQGTMRRAIYQNQSRDERDEMERTLLEESELMSLS